MYKVFLADDESAMRTGVRNNLDWDNSDFLLAGEAPDGEMALSLMQEIMPDILITDVRMPFMDGIELSRIVRKTMPWVKIIILSGHDEFEYAKQAITIGVEEYLLKPVTSEKLMETLGEVAGHIEEEKEKLRNVEKLIDDVKKNRMERFLVDLLHGNISTDKALPLSEELELNILSDYYLIMLIELEDLTEDNDNSFNSADMCISGVLNDWGNINYFSQGLNRTVCVFNGKEPAALEEDAYTCAQAVKYEVERNLPLQVSIMIGSVVSDIDEWQKSMTEAEAAGKNAKGAVSGSKNSDVIVKAKKYIKENYSQQDITLHSVAREVSISPNHFCTVFKQETGETFISYLTKIRIEHAKTLLKTTPMRTSDICYDVGYNDTHYFSYVFKKNTGMSPKEFRNN